MTIVALFALAFTRKWTGIYTSSHAYFVGSSYWVPGCLASFLLVISWLASPLGNFFILLLYTLSLLLLLSLSSSFLYRLVIHAQEHFLGLVPLHYRMLARGLYRMCMSRDSIPILIIKKFGSKHSSKAVVRTRGLR